MRERCVTAGGRDGSLRLWKIVEESHLVFTGHKYVITYFLKYLYYLIFQEVQSIV